MNVAMISTAIVLGLAQTLAWASSYYLPAIVAVPMARDLAIDESWIYGAFSAALLIGASMGPRIGRTIDRFGGREVLAASNVVIAASLAILAVSETLAVMCAGWLLLGVGMAMGLYDAAFAALGRLFGDGARPAIVGTTLLGGFASTVGWPLTAWGIATIGWRDTCLAWAAANLLLGLPLNYLLLPAIPKSTADHRPITKPHIAMDRRMWLLATGFALGWMVASAMAVHLPRILEIAGATPTEAIAAAALVGPAQVAARLGEAWFLRRYHPLIGARLAAAAHPIGAVLLALSSGAFPYGFVLLHGAGNGILTIVRGTVPLAVFGAENYGYRLGLIGAPARLAQAFAPLIFGILITSMGAWVLAVSSCLGLLAMAAFLGISRR